MNDQQEEVEGDQSDPGRGATGSVTPSATSQVSGTNSNSNAAPLEEDDIAFAAEAAANAVEAADAEQERLDLTYLRCRICGQGILEGRPILRFQPVDHDAAAGHAAPGVLSFTQDICLHIFCGKTASILPTVNQPELEILTKAGLKNKHGIGPEVNAALARTRCAIVPQQQGTKEKQYYLVREFEAHLAAIRHTHISFVSDGANKGPTNGPPPTLPVMAQNTALNQPTTVPPTTSNGQHLALSSNNSTLQANSNNPMAPLPGITIPTPTPYAQVSPPLAPLNNPAAAGATINGSSGIGQPPQDWIRPQPELMTNHPPTMDVLPNTPSDDPAEANLDTSGPPAPATTAPTTAVGGPGTPYSYYDANKLLPVRASVGRISKPSAAAPSTITMSPPAAVQYSMPTYQCLTDEGKVRCACGGTHLPTDSPRGAASWKTHLQTKRHQKWMESQGIAMESQGLLGAV